MLISCSSILPCNTCSSIIKEGIRGMDTHVREVTVKNAVIFHVNRSSWVLVLKKRICSIGISVKTHYQSYSVHKKARKAVRKVMSLFKIGRKSTKCFHPALTRLHSEWPKLYWVLAILSAIGFNMADNITAETVPQLVLYGWTRRSLWPSTNASWSVNLHCALSLSV